METNQTDTVAVVKRFYEAFARLDAETMKTCYADDATFEDPAFGKLVGADIGWMWQMLCASQQDQTFVVRFTVEDADDTHATVNWEAEYLFSKTGRPVHNRIQAYMTFENGLIKTHVDTFNLRKWATQALGFQGRLLGGTAFFAKKLNQQTNGMLQRYKAKETE